MAFKLFDRVQEVSTSTGTGDFTLGGAITGYKSFASRYSVGDTMYYGIHEVNGSGVPTGAWEIGLGTYSAANTLTRTTILSSSNSDAVVNFSSGSKWVFLAMTALQGSSIREKLTADRTYYVRTDGSDSNNGLSNTSGGAFLTVQKAIDVVSETLDMARKVVTIQLGDGTYTGAIVMRPLVGNNALTIQGNNSTPANVLISTTSSNAITNSVGGTTLTVKDLKLQTTTSGSCLSSSAFSTITFTNLIFGSCAGNHINAQGGARITSSSAYAISGGANCHFFANGYGYVQVYNNTITLTGTPAFSSYFAGCNTPGGIETWSNTFSGSATGKRYDVSGNGVVYTGGGGSTYYPGNTSGTTATGGQYI